MRRLVWTGVLLVLATACGDSGSQKVSGSNTVTSALKPRWVRGTMSCTRGKAGGAQITFRDAGQGQIRHFDLFCSHKDPVALDSDLASPTKLKVTIPAGTVDMLVQIFVYQTYPGVLGADCTGPGTGTAVLPSALPATVTCNGGGLSGSVTLR
jgi:hypothetical protein